MKKCIVCGNGLTGNQRKFCSGSCKQKDHWKKHKKQRNTYHHQTMRSYERKLKLIELSGGKCQECGYNKNIAALQFHHRNPVDKCFPLDGRNLSNRKMEDLLSEHKKCDLLCANCHSEHHNPEMFLENVKVIIENKGPISPLAHNQ